jgi:hypothetical protein
MFKGMFKGLSSFKKIKFPQRKIFWIILMIVTAALLYFFGVEPLFEARRKAEEEITLKKKIILKYDQYVKHRKMIEEELDRTVKAYEAVQQRLLPGESPHLGAVHLQEIIKRLSEKNGIGIRSFRILEPKEMNVYRKVSVQIDFNPVNSMLSLGQFLHDIEHHEKELMISEMDLLVMNPRMPTNIQGNLVISGWMKGGKVKEKGREG